MTKPRKRGRTPRAPTRDAARRASPLAPPRLPDLAPADPPRLGDIPWAYGQNRVTALARDPHWLFVYWELTDEALARARAEVGSADAACVLRVYDTTWRLFDGTNANWFFDVPVHRPANNHYVCVNRPASTFHVEIGVKSPGGSFAGIARSGAVETPRDSISPETGVEWMTVTHGVEALREYHHRVAPVPQAPAGAARIDLERVMQAFVGEGWSRGVWEEREDGGRGVGRVRWMGPIPQALSRTDAGERVEIVFEGERRVIVGAWGQRVVVGPWRVAIHAVGTSGEERVIDRWTIHYAWATEEGSGRQATEAILARIVRGYWAAPPGTGSEGRLLLAAWGSEALQAGASEWRWLHGSEAQLGGASERSWLAASEWSWPGASERSWLAASEWSWPGASERWLGGAGEGPLR